MKIHKTSIIHKDTIIGENVEIGPYCIIEKNAFVGANSFVKTNTVVPEGKIYAGNPAKFFRDVSQQERNFFSLGQKIYENLSLEYLKNSYD